MANFINNLLIGASTHGNFPEAGTIAPPTQELTSEYKLTEQTSSNKKLTEQTSSNKKATDNSLYEKLNSETLYSPDSSDLKKWLVFEARLFAAKIQTEKSEGVIDQAVFCNQPEVNCVEKLEHLNKFNLTPKHNQNEILAEYLKRQEMNIENGRNIYPIIDQNDYKLEQTTDKATRYLKS